MTFRLYLDIGNDAMSDWQDIADALRTVAAAVEDDGTVTTSPAKWIRDTNGNRVGTWKVGR